MQRIKTSYPRLIIVLFLFTIVGLQAQFTFTTGDFTLGISENGRITELSNSATQQNYLATDLAASLLTLVSADTRYLPTSATAGQNPNTVVFAFGDIGVTIDVQITPKDTHLVLELVKATSEDKIDAVVWGPFPTTIGKTIGEIIGVVRDDQVALGLQALNIETLGGRLSQQ
ncbi:hypothetical protein N9L94_06705 [Robiginitalea sp.]|nr:hypothetical protein [Robiginitalea sp.]